MNPIKTLFSLSLATLGLAASAVSASAFTIAGQLNGEAAFEALAPTISWAAESRIGVVGNGDYEIDIHNSTFTNPVTAQYSWVNGKAEAFTLNYDGNSLLTYTVGSKTVTQTVNKTNFADMFLRTTARKNGSSISLQNLKLTDTRMSQLLNVGSSFACNVAAGCGYYDSSQYLKISGIAGAFTLTGESVMSWLPTNAPTRSNLAYQIKLVEGAAPVESVPEPATISLLSLAALGLGFGRKRQNSQV